MRHARTVAAPCALVAGLAALAACGDPLGLPAATFTNDVDSVSLYALSGTPPATPSAYRVEFRQIIRVDQTATFDFAFDIDTAGRALLLPTGALGLGRNSGVQVTSQTFDSVRVAPTRGYALDSAVVVSPGSIAIVQSQLALCTWGGQAFYYAKLLVLDVDTNGRRIDFLILANTNCGYRGLEPGLPRR
jgi:hypothetical protein